MNIKLRHLVYASVILISFDSLLKIGVQPFYLQAGILTAFGALIVSYLMNNSPKYKPDHAVLLIAAYIAVHYFLALNTFVYLVCAAYFGTFLSLYTLIRRTHRQVNWQKISRTAVIILLATGYTQYFLINALDIQIELRDISASYYAEKGNLGTRMRGFFLEPNWFGLSLFGWGFLYIFKTKTYKRIDTLIIFLAIIAIYLSDNRLIFVLSLYILVMFYICGRFPKLSKFAPFLTVSAAMSLFIGVSVYFPEIADRSAAARTYTMARVWQAWTQADIATQIFGYGFSNWGHYSNAWSLSWSNFRLDQSLARRDNAEVYVFLFEMGIISFIIFAADLIFIGKKAKQPLSAVFVSAIYISALFYPIYNFLMYLIPLMVIRHEIIQQADTRSPLNQ